MATPFAALETRLNQAVFSRLANVEAKLDGTDVVGILDAGFADATLAGYGDGPGTSPVLTLESASVPANAPGKLLVIASGPSAGTYRIANARHDGTGVCTLELLTQ